MPNTLRSLLEESIDLQGVVNKSVLKKLAKLPSDNQQYFIDNSAIKTTEEYRRITEKASHDNWYSLFKLIKEHQVKLAFEDLVELSNSMAPRLFTMASHAQTQRNVIIAASLVDNGLISKFILARPQ